MAETRPQQLQRYILETEARIQRLLAISPRMADSICVANMLLAIEEHKVELAGGAR